MATVKGYKTKQKELILDFLVTNKDRHVSAEELVDNLKSSGNSVGKSTVYRQLDKLVLQGYVRKFFVEEGIGACYQYCDGSKCNEHYHLKCLQCGKLFHVKCNYLDTISTHVGNTHKFIIDNSKTVLYGICENCGASDDKKE